MDIIIYIRNNRLPTTCHCGHVCAVQNDPKPWTYSLPFCALCFGQFAADDYFSQFRYTTRKTQRAFLCLNPLIFAIIFNRCGAKLDCSIQMNIRNTGILSYTAHYDIIFATPFRVEEMTSIKFHLRMIHLWVSLIRSCLIILDSAGELFLLVIWKFMSKNLTIQNLRGVLHLWSPCTLFTMPGRCVT